MAVPSRHEGDHHIVGTLSAGDIRYPALSIGDADIEAAAAIQASKLERHQSIDIQHFAEGTLVSATSSHLLHIVRGSSGQSVGFEAVIHTAAGATDSFCYIDLQKCTASTTWVSILSAAIAFASSDAVRTPKAGTINTAALTDGDMLRTVITVTGTTNARGLQSSYTYSERYS